MTGFERLFRTTEEQKEPVEATVSGNIPEWLSGTMLTVGPGVFDLDSGFTVNHLYDGYSILCKFSIDRGKVKFSKRYLTSNALKKAQRNGKPVFTEFATRAYPEPTMSIVAGVIEHLVPEITDNCNRYLIKIGDTYLVKTESANIRVINADDLATGMKVDLLQDLGIYMICGNVITDHNGDVYVLAGRSKSWPPRHRLKHIFMKIPFASTSLKHALRNTKTLCKFAPPSDAYLSLIQSFGLTNNYIIFIDQPLSIDRYKITDCKRKGHSLKDCLNWDPEQMNRFYIIEKGSGNVLPVVYESSQPFYFTDVINAYETPNRQIVIDLIASDGPDVLDHLLIDNVRKRKFHPKNLPQSRRYTIPIIDNIENTTERVNVREEPTPPEAIKCNGRITLSHQVINKTAHEKPAINIKYLSRKHKYFYATGLYYEGESQYSLIKVDAESGEVKKWFAGHGRVPNGPIFIENPNSSSEDDGLLVASVTASEPDDLDRLVVLDARSMQVIAFASVPCHVPLSNHCVYITK